MGVAKPLFLRRMIGRGIMSLKPQTWNRLVPQQPQFGERIYKVAELLPLDGPENIYRHLVSQFREPEALVLGGREPEVPLLDPALQPKGLSFAERMMYGDALSYLPNDVLTKVDRASMAVALEVRAPLLDKNLFQFAWSLPHRMKIREGKNGLQGKWLLRQVLQKHVPAAMFERPKQGFTIPIGDWLRFALRDWAENLLDEQRLVEQGFLDARVVRDIWQAHLDGHGRYAHQLWTMLMFQSWLRNAQG